ncbi:MAG: histidine kinase [Lachnospiraceae bacterium]|nr:histidine kinase [Lachnospiraceae bacterium]
MLKGLFKGLANQTLVNHLTMIIPLLLQLLGLSFAVLIDSYIDRRQKKIMSVLVHLVLSLIVQNYAEYFLTSVMPMPYLRTIVSIYGYCIRPAILVPLICIVSPECKLAPVLILIAANTSVYMTALFSHIAFYISYDNTFHRGVLGGFCLYASMVLLLYLLYLTIRKYRAVKKLEMLIPIANTLFIIMAVIMDGNVGLSEQPVTFLTISIVSSCVFFYIWLHLQFVRRHERELKDGQRVQIMLSQIKPHFLYNALGAIEELCESDPKKAKEATVTFSRYLRGNMSSISASDSIPFEKELSHTKIYLELEKLRFEDALQVDYDITVKEFKIPTLTLEPLAENAVRHGVRGNADGRGSILISTREYPDHIEVSVIDDGPGFSPEMLADDEHYHIGLQNVRERLMQICKGSLELEALQGRGTKATIILPREKES